MPSCNDCRFARGHSLANQPIDAVNPEKGFVTFGQGVCHRRSPRLIDRNTAGWPPIKLAAWCGEHRYSIIRLIKILFGRAI